MFIKSSVTLIYEGQGVASNGSPVTSTIRETVRCDEAETFSNQYYTEQERNMRESRNLIVPTYMTESFIREGLRYELMYVEYLGIRYKVRNILKVKNTRHRMLLDIQEIR